MTERIIVRDHPVTQALIELQQAVPESRIVYENEYPNALPMCTVDGNRQVISLKDQLPTGYDLWVPRRKPRPGDHVTCSDFGASFAQAVAFLRGVPLKAIREMGGVK